MTEGADTNAEAVADQTEPKIHWTWRFWRLEIVLFRSVVEGWKRNGEKVSFGFYAPIPGTPIPGGIKSAAIIVRSRMLVFFWNARQQPAT